MRKVAAMLLVPSIMLLGCSEPVPERPVSVLEVRDNIHAWNGETVTIDGWLGECRGYDCRIYNSLSDARTVELSVAKKGAWMEAFGRTLGIASNTDFDAEAIKVPFTRIRLTAKVSDECRGSWTSCLDRVPDLYVISFKPIETSKDK